MRIEVLVGMIGSGKSTYARRRAGEGAIVVCHDDLTAMLHAENRYEQGLRATYREMEESLATCVLGANRDLVIDRTHLTRESRERWLSFEAEACFDDYRVIAVAFPIETPETHARRRFSADSRGRSYEEWLKVAEHHYSQAIAEPLDWREEGFDGMFDPAIQGLR